MQLQPFGITSESANDKAVVLNPSPGDPLLLAHHGSIHPFLTPYRRVEQGRTGGLPLDPSCLAQSSQSQVIMSKPDYNSALCRQQTVLHTMELTVSFLSRNLAPQTVSRFLPVLRGSLPVAGHAL